jgi:hypothetical protein
LLPFFPVSLHSIVLTGGKRSYCMEDSSILPGWSSPLVPCSGSSTCTDQGLQVGWKDVYGPSLDCQYLDITDLAPGRYVLEQCVNPFRVDIEASYDNNCIRTDVTIPPKRRVLAPAEDAEAA